ncbi:pentraxin-related protein PTX3-like [Sinocyclocheilus anshuiensis]|uniref:Pentraxin-related protein PTX3-like n=1 Tax=Sinocyclocheilus anshuiensis TaxID=1608454 RepID=A0A671R129_9TELE|nr:PREDICTED: pentraxin-related protein PTX3-like [Sinocyclocheilus anshuiensis]
MASMSKWTFLQAMCLVVSLSTAVPENYEDDIDVNFGPNYLNEITEEDQMEGETPTPSPEPCKGPVFTKWDKLFTMLENSQMKENMLLQYADDIIKVELQSLREEMLQFVAQYGGSCASAVESSVRRAGIQTETRLQNALDRVREVSADQSSQHDAALQQLLAVSVNQAARLERLENDCLKWGGGGLASQAKSFQARHLMQEVTETENGGRLEKTLAVISSELQTIREQLTLYTKSVFVNSLPSGETSKLQKAKLVNIFTTLLRGALSKKIGRRSKMGILEFKLDSNLRVFNYVQEMAQITDHTVYRKVKTHM